MIKIERLKEIFKNTSEDQRDLVESLLYEVVFLEKRMSELQKKDFIVVHPRIPGKQKKSEAWKQYRECSQLHANILRILIGVLNKANTGGADELIALLEKY